MCSNTQGAGGVGLQPESKRLGAGAQEHRFAGRRLVEQGKPSTSSATDSLAAIHAPSARRPMTPGRTPLGSRSTARVGWPSSMSAATIV